MKNMFLQKLAIIVVSIISVAIPTSVAFGALSQYGLPGIYNATPFNLSDGSGSAVSTDSNGRVLISPSSVISSLTLGNVTTTNLAVLNQFSIPVGGNALAPLGINSTSPNASLAVKGLSTMDVVNFTSSTNSSLFKILKTGYSGLNVNTPQAVFDVRDVAPTTTNGAIFQVANSAGDLSYMFVSSTATTIRGMSGAVNFELGVSTDNGSQVLIHGDNAAVSSDATKALVVNGRGNLYLQSGGTTRMLVASNGVIAVNTTTVSGGLFIIQSIAGVDSITVASTTGNNMFKIRSNGNVGFGTSTPTNNLTVSSGTTTTVAIGYPGVGKVCQWNGASWTITAYA